MRNMTLWSAAGLSVAAAAVSTSQGGAGEAMIWLAELYGSGSVVDTPKLAIQQLKDDVSPSVSMGLGLISAALLTGGLLPGGAEPSENTGCDPDKVIAAMARVAAATGGISPPEFAEKVTGATGIELSADEAALALRTCRSDAEAEDLDRIVKGTGLAAREKILRAALEVGWTHGTFSPGGLEMIGRLARAMEVSGDDLALLFWEVTEPPLHARPDAFERLRPRSKMLGRAQPA